MNFGLIIKASVLSDALILVIYYMGLFYCVQQLKSYCQLYPANQGISLLISALQ